MWISKAVSLSRAAEREGASTDMGVTTIGGASASVLTRGEQRALEVFAPGGLVWRPRAGDTVLVLRGGVGGQEQCVVAADTAAAAPEDLAPGELFLFSDGGASIRLRADGAIAVKGPVSLEGDLAVSGDVELTGAVSIRGSLTVNGAPYRPCACEEASHGA